MKKYSRKKYLFGGKEYSLKEYSQIVSTKFNVPYNLVRSRTEQNKPFEFVIYPFNSNKIRYNPIRYSKLQIFYYSKLGKLLKIFMGFNNAAIELGFPKSTVSGCCLRKGFFKDGSYVRCLTYDNRVYDLSIIRKKWQNSLAYSKCLLKSEYKLTNISEELAQAHLDTLKLKRKLGVSQFHHLHSYK